MWAATLTLLAVATAQQLYVSTNGNDGTGTGTQAAPWASIQKAVSAIRGLNADMAADIAVFVRAGAYFIQEPISFGPADSSSNGFQIQYIGGWPGDAPAPVVIHAGVQVQGWKQVGSGVWAASLPDGVADTRQFYVGNDRVNVTNSGGGLPGSVAITPTGYTTSDALAWAFAAEQDPASIELLYTGVGSSWTECRVRVSAVSRLSNGGTNITMAQPGFDLARGRYYGQGVSTPASVANVVALLSSSTPGQGAINSATRTLYYAPRPTDDMATAVFTVPALDTLLVAQGNRNAQPTIQHVSGLTFVNLQFSFAGWLLPNSGQGYVDMQSGFMIFTNSSANDETWLPLPGNLQFSTVSSIRIVGCVFAHLGATALMIDSGSMDVVVANNTFWDVSAGGVYFGNANDANVTDPTRLDAHFLIDGNTFTNIPVEFHDAAVICGGFVENATIQFNSIVNNSNTGISLGWGWSRDEATNARNNAILSNYVFGSNWLLEDGGSIYVLGPQPQSIIAHNYVSNQHKLFGALYTDEGSAYWNIFDNVVNNVPEWLHIWTPTIHDEAVYDCWTNQAYMINHGTNCTVENITYLSAGQQFPPAAQFVIDQAGSYGMVGPKP